MAVSLPRSVFLHNRKTGGMWVREVLNQFSNASVLGKPDAKHLRDGPRTIIHMTFKEALALLGGHRLFFFTFVRHPFTWMESYYAHRVRDDQWPSSSWAHSSFEEWVLRTPRGWVQRQFEAFTGPLRHEVDFIGRFEDLQFDLRRALKAAREKFSDDIFDIEPQNVGDSTTLAKCSWTQQMRKRVHKLNPQAFSRYGYSLDEVPERRFNQGAAGT